MAHTCGGQQQTDKNTCCGTVISSPKSQANLCCLQVTTVQASTDKAVSCLSMCSGLLVNSVGVWTDPVAVHTLFRCDCCNPSWLLQEPKRCNLCDSGLIGANDPVTGSVKQDCNQPFAGHFEPEMHTLTINDLPRTTPQNSHVTSAEHDQLRCHSEGLMSITMTLHSAMIHW